MFAETFFYYFGVGSAVVLTVAALPWMFALPAVVTTLLGRGVLELVLWWDEYWLEYDDVDDNYESAQNKHEAYMTAKDNGRWETKVSHTLSETHKMFEKATELYIELIDEQVWNRLPLVGR